jgi:adenine-specific DNA-methyltransferase
MATQFESFRETMKKVLMLDQADLDFGIYRIMNLKRNEIENYLNNDLKAQVTASITANSDGKSASLHQKLSQLIETLSGAGVDPESSPKVKELREMIAASGNSEDLENEVYSHLTTFFSRYYDGGDFISQRRYKKDVYAIPYEGEEVKLYWANADQYYIKTGEYFRNYRFKLGDGKVCEFTLKDVNTEQNNNVAQNNMERRFALFEETPVEVIDGELHINFTYELYPKATKQKALMEQAKAKIIGLIPKDFVGVFAPLLTDSSRTLLDKHLNDYVARNTFDYFIHKDLEGFLSRELDFYIKNEVLFIDDIDSRNPDDFVKHITIIKAIKDVGKKLITFLASLENYQKKLWLKKKFVVQADYCITLDRVPEELYSEICANDAQREKWVKFFAINEIEGFMGGSDGYSVPLTIDFLKANPFLVLDTQFFTDEFKHRLIASIDNIDEQCDGLLINSDNFQALEFLQEKYKETIKSIYLDPPYNTGSDNTFLYKDSYQHSSWVSMMFDRIKESFNLQTAYGSIFISTDDGEYTNIKNVGDIIYGPNNFMFDVIWNSRKSVSNDAIISVATNHTTFFSKNKDLLTANKNEFRIPYFSNNFSNPDNDPKEDWTADPMDAPNIRENLSYPITNPKTGQVFYPPKGRHWRFKEDDVKKYLKEGRIIFGKSGTSRPQFKRYLSEALEKGMVTTSLWDDVDTTSSATTLLYNYFDGLVSRNVINMMKPKPCNLVERVCNVSTNDDSIILDYFAGSGTTGHAVINLNRNNKRSHRKYILCDMGNHFDILMKPRIEKVIYSRDWSNGKPVSREGISQCFKYMHLEQYEDTLNNMVLQPTNIDHGNGKFYHGYLLGYLLDTETKESLFSLKWFRNPWAMKLNITKNNEMKEETIDLVETFNYLIGLNVKSVLYPKDGICTVEGVTRKGEKTLIIWRDCDKISNEALNDFFVRSNYATNDNEFDRIYVNGDNNLQNLHTDDDSWKVVLTEQEFQKRMFEEC